jgi:predicted nucleotidyltransferase
VGKNRNIEERGVPRNLSIPSRKSAKYRNPKGAAKYFGPYKRNLEEIKVEDDVDIKKIEMHDELNPKIWDESKKLKPEIRKALVKIAKQYYEFLELDKKVKDIIFTGSLANYNWTDTSDIDVHLILDYSDLDEEDKEFLNEYLYMKKKIWNDTHNITVKGHEVEAFAKDTEEQHTNKAIYSLAKNEWIVEPTKDMPAIDVPAIKRKAAIIMNQVDELESISDRKKRYQKADKIKEKIKKYRTSGLQRGGEFDNENLVFKTLRNNGYLDKLSNIKTGTYDDMMSLDETIKKVGDEYVVYPKKGGKRLGSHKTRKAAEKQLAAIEISKHKKMNESEMMPDKVVKHTLKVQKGIPGMTDEKVDIIKDFIGFTCFKLKIGEPVSVYLRRGRDEYIVTTASYVPDKNENHIRCGGRALVDILRSIAHELTHNRQREMGKFKPGDTVQNIGGHMEDEANSKAGILIKDFTHNYGYDNIYDL